VPESNPLN